MSDDFSTQQPITQQRAERAVQWIIDHAVELAQARAHKERSEHMIKVTKALAMKASGEKSISAQERDAIASEQYMQSVDLLFDASVLFETLNAKHKSAAVLVETWRSINSSLRAAKV